LPLPALRCRADDSPGCDLRSVAERAQIELSIRHAPPRTTQTSAPCRVPCQPIPSGGELPTPPSRPSADLISNRMIARLCVVLLRVGPIILRSETCCISCGGFSASHRGPSAAPSRAAAASRSLPPARAMPRGSVPVAISFSTSASGARQPPARGHAEVVRAQIRSWLIWMPAFGACARFTETYAHIILRFSVSIRVQQIVCRRKIE